MGGCVGGSLQDTTLLVISSGGSADVPPPPPSIKSLSWESQTVLATTERIEKAGPSSLTMSCKATLVLSLLFLQTYGW